MFSSDLQRDLQTARVVGDLLHVEPVVDRRLREKSYGQAEGKPQAWLDQRFNPPSAFGDRMRHDEGLPGAETKASFAQRFYAVLDAILESSCDHQIIVSHSATSTSGSTPEVSRNSGRTTTSTTARSSASVTLAISPLDSDRRERSGPIMLGNLDAP